MEERLVELFRGYLPAWNWEEWQAAGASDKEDIVINALADLGPDMPIEVDEVYDIFWDWAAGLTEADFNTSLTEAKRIISNPDILYHATEAENLYKILSEDTLKGSINTRANINAVCLTTDANYTIYYYPCKIQFSRELLTKGGYEFIPYDEFADDTEGSGESEERVLGDITEVSKYITAVHLNWDQIAIAKSIQPGAEGSYISGPRYAKHTNDEDEAWDLRYEDFIAALKKLQASGVYIFQEGRKTYRYWIDENGKPHTGKMPPTIPAAV